MALSYVDALQQVTGPKVRTQWPDERWDVPAIKEEDRAVYTTWLQETGALSKKQWKAVRTHWISFLSATGASPNVELAPDRKKFHFIDDPPWTMEKRSQNRFNTDRRTRRNIQAVLWQGFDGLEALTERWPSQARVLLNRPSNPTTTRPFQTFAAKTDWHRRRQFDSVWLALICFLVHALDEADTLKQMGLSLSEDTYDDVLDVSQAMVMQVPELLEDAINNLCRSMIMDRNATPSYNPLLWWVTVLVQSALDPLDRDDYISRGRFSLNILPMDFDVRSRMEAVQHFAKVFTLDLAFRKWDPKPAQWAVDVGADLDRVDNSWMNADTDERPRDEDDTRRCNSAAWREMLKRLAKQANTYLGGDEGTVFGQVQRLLA